jgi:hypothetical protein
MTFRERTTQVVAVNKVDHFQGHLSALTRTLLQNSRGFALRLCAAERELQWIRGW